MPSATRLLRTLGRRAGAAPPVPLDASGAGHDSWLKHLYGDELAALDAACARDGAGALPRFSALDDDLWALLLTQEHSCYPHIRAVLPGVPSPALQAAWNGVCGVPLAAQGAAFYARLRARYAEAGPCPLAESRVLDFGCGWGRLTRFLARDVAPGMLYGCDPSEAILDVCREHRVPAVLARSAPVPERLPFDEPFDLAFAFSVFTHLSEPAHLSCLAALHAGLRPGGVLIATVRPPAYRDLMPLMAAARGAPLEGARHLFVPHAADPAHPQYEGGEMTYGEAVVTIPYVRERWSRWFELLHADLLIGDLHQVVLTLRRT